MVNALKEVLAIIDRIFNPKKVDEALGEELYRDLVSLNDLLRKFKSFVDQKVSVQIFQPLFLTLISNLLFLLFAFFLYILSSYFSRILTMSIQFNKN